MDVPFWVSSALSAADFGFLRSVKCFGRGGWGPTIPTSAVLFKYRHSRGRRLDPPSGKLATNINKDYKQ